MCLAGNACPELQYSVRQCARFTHVPHHSHDVAVKRIAHHLQGMLESEQGLTFKATTKLNLDLHVDADYAGLWTHEDDQDPICVKSRTGHVVTLGDCPIHFSSKLQTKIALSTLEAEYIALSQGMREFVALRRAFMELTSKLVLICEPDSLVKSKIFEDNNGCISTCFAPKLSPRTKHIAVKYHFVRQFFNMDPSISRNHPFVLLKIDSASQKADLFTKGFSTAKFLELRKLLCGH